MVVIGMESGEGIIAYENAVEVASASSISSQPDNAPDTGVLFVGRRSYTNDNWYVTAEIDEIAIFDKVLSADEVQTLYDMYSPYFP